jgi:uncharacterized protein YcfJ
MGQYMKSTLRVSLLVAGLALALPALAQVTFYEREGFAGRSFSTQSQVNNLDRYGFNDRASSVIVTSERWEVCEDARYSGRCVVLRQGSYPSLAAMGLNDRVTSTRMISRNTRVDDQRYAPPPQQVVDYRPRRNERLFEADVTAVRAVMGTPEQRCWVEKEQVSTPTRGDANVGGAVVGGLLGGILGHQVGGGFGKDLATVGGVAAGAAIGANVGRDRNGERITTQNVQRCANQPGSARPDYWDVTYNFRGKEHRIQTATQPGSTITVNRDGEPRT